MLNKKNKNKYFFSSGLFVFKEYVSHVGMEKAAKDIVKSEKLSKKGETTDDQIVSMRDKVREYGGGLVKYAKQWAADYPNSDKIKDKVDLIVWEIENFELNVDIYRSGGPEVDERAFFEHVIHMNLLHLRNIINKHLGEPVSHDELDAMSERMVPKLKPGQRYVPGDVKRWKGKAHKQAIENAKKRLAHFKRKYPKNAAIEEMVNNFIDEEVVSPKFEFKPGAKRDFYVDSVKIYLTLVDNMMKEQFEVWRDPRRPEQTRQIKQSLRQLLSRNLFSLRKSVRVISGEPFMDRFARKVPMRIKSRSFTGKDQPSEGKDKYFINTVVYLHKMEKIVRGEVEGVKDDLMENLYRLGSGMNNLDVEEFGRRLSEIKTFRKNLEASKSNLAKTKLAKRLEKAIFRYEFSKIAKSDRGRYFRALLRESRNYEGFVRAMEGKTVALRSLKRFVHKEGEDYMLDVAGAISSLESPTGANISRGTRLKKKGKLLASILKGHGYVKLSKSVEKQSGYLITGIAKAERVLAERKEKRTPEYRVAALGKQSKDVKKKKKNLEEETRKIVKLAKALNKARSKNDTPKLADVADKLRRSATKLESEARELGKGASVVRKDAYGLFIALANEEVKPSMRVKVGKIYRDSLKIKTKLEKNGKQLAALIKRMPIQIARVKPSNENI